MAKIRNGTFAGIQQAARPEIQGEAMRLRKGEWYWRRGPLEVEVGEAIDFDQNGKRAWFARVAVFDQLVAEDWKPTAIRASAWASAQLAKIERALLAPRPVGRSER